MKNLLILLFSLFTSVAFSQLDIVVTTNYTPLYPADGDTLSVCRDSLIIFEAEVTDGGVPVTNAQYYWDFDDGNKINGNDLDSVTHDFGDQYNGGGGYRVKLTVIDQPKQGFIIIPVKVSVLPNFSQTEAVLNEGQIGICKGSLTPLNGIAYPILWEDKPIYEISEDPKKRFDDSDPYSDSLFFDEFPMNTVYSAGNIDSIGITIEHSNMGNVKISLSCENGTTVILKDNILGNTSTLGEPTTNTPFTYYFSASSGNDIMNNAITNPISEQDYLPEESFNNFIGCDLNGKWMLTVEDNQTTDSGFVYSWKIIFEESVLPEIWTFHDTLLQYKDIDGTLYGTYWTGDNVGATSLQTEVDTIRGFAQAAPDIYGPNSYDFHVITNWGCPQDTSIILRVEELTFTAEPNPAEANTDPPVTFTNTTSWVEERYWVFGDGNDTLSVNPDDTSVKHMYEEKGEYNAVLTANDAGGCQDTYSLKINVLVEQSKLENIPNMFSPDGDGINDVFYIVEDKLKGMDEFVIVIYNRWGELVYKTEDPEEIRNVGWNGKTRLGLKNNAGLKAAPGIYYYVIRATGKDGKEYKGSNRKKDKDDENVITKEVKGTIHLFR